jgi:xanthine/CO dehydrogenase XdhC/CoxF family maturation factor
MRGFPGRLCLAVRLMAEGSGEPQGGAPVNLEVLMRDVLDAIEGWRAEGHRVALATVTKVKGSAPRPPGAKMAVSDDGRWVGSVSGGCVEGAVLEEAGRVLAGEPAHLVTFGITDEMVWDVGLACGGIIDVFVEPLP